MATIVINGSNITASKSVVISNDKVIVDGVDVTPDSKEVSIVVNGDLEYLDVAACKSLHVKGDVGSVKTVSGDVQVSGSVTDSVKTVSGSVNCGGNIGGSVKTVSGDIKHRS